MSIAFKSSISTLPLPARAHRASPVPVPDILTATVHLAQPGTVVVTVRGDVDLSSAPYLREVLREQVHHAGPDLILDLTGVVFFGGVGLAVLTGVSADAILAKIGFRVVACTRAVLLPMRITGVDTVLDVHPDLDSTPMRPWLPLGRR